MLEIVSLVSLFAKPIRRKSWAELFISSLDTQSHMRAALCNMRKRNQQRELAIGAFWMDPNRLKVKKKILISYECE